MPSMSLFICLLQDMRNIRFTHQQTNHSRRPLYESLQRFAFPVTNKAVSFTPGVLYLDDDVFILLMTIVIRSIPSLF